MTREDALELPTLGMRIVFLQRTAATGGEFLEYDVIGRPRGFPAQAHVHPRQSERHETISGSLLVKLDGATRILGPGESIEIPPGKPHRHYAAGEADGHVRVTLKPALRTEQLLEWLAELDASGAVTKGGYLKPLAAARLILDFPDEGRAAQPPAALQRALARTVSWAAESRGEYTFVDEWDVAAPAEAVFDLIADARTYPSWWRPVYIDVESEGEPRLGAVSAQHFKGRLPYHLRTRSTITLYDRPHSIGADVVGDLRGRGLGRSHPRAPGRTCASTGPCSPTSLWSER